MNDLSQQIELLKLQIQLAQIKTSVNDNNMVKQNTQPPQTTPPLTLKEIMSKICSKVTFNDVLKYSRDINAVCWIFEEYYPCYEKVIYIVDKCYYVYDINPDEDNKVMWFKVTRKYITEKTLRKIDNALIKKMWEGFTEEDKEWFRNEKLSHVNMLTSHDVLLNSDRDDDVWNSLTTRLTNLF